VRAIFPFFIREVLPAGLKGLLIAGLFAAAMSSVDSALGALSSSAALDLYKPLRKPEASEAEMLRLSRQLILFFAVVLAIFAWLLRDTEEFLFLTFKLASIPSGALLGVFLLGLGSARGTDRGCLLAMLVGSSLTAVALILIETGYLPLAWSWLILFNTALTFSLALVLSRLGK
jgi:solute:Na+ symporter, SSS family